MRVKIISGGTAPQTQVVDADTGEPLHDVRSVTWKCDAGDFATAVIVLENVEAELVGEVAASQ